MCSAASWLDMQRLVCAGMVLFKDDYCTISICWRQSWLTVAVMMVAPVSFGWPRLLYCSRVWRGMLRQFSADGCDCCSLVVETGGFCRLLLCGWLRLYCDKSADLCVVSSGWAYFEGKLVRDRSSRLMYDITLVGRIAFWSLVVAVFKGDEWMM